MSFAIEFLSEVVAMQWKATIILTDVLLTASLSSLMLYGMTIEIQRSALQTYLPG